MLVSINKSIRSLLKISSEHNKIVWYAKKFCPSTSSKLLDVGCGEGRYLSSLTNLGYDVLGVEQNEVIVNRNKLAGLNCVTVDDFLKDEKKFDLILISHVIEHFEPNGLKVFLENYLRRLRTGGILIIATPLMNPRFYDDFDHIKPYSPVGIMMVFGSEASQVQYYSSEKMQLLDVWFRSSYFRPSNYRGRYIPSTTGRIYFLIEIASALLWRLSFGLIGRKDGWVGVFQKISQ
jgi:SAM-dependent methyltransferase